MQESTPYEHRQERERQCDEHHTQPDRQRVDCRRQNEVPAEVAARATYIRHPTYERRCAMRIGDNPNHLPPTVPGIGGGRLGPSISPNGWRTNDAHRLPIRVTTRGARPWTGVTHDDLTLAPDPARSSRVRDRGSDRPTPRNRRAAKNQPQWYRDALAAQAVPRDGRHVRRTEV